MRRTKIAADDTLIFFYFYLSKKIRLEVSCESSAEQRIHLKHQVLFSLKNNENIFMNVSAEVVIGALRVKRMYSPDLLLIGINL